MNNSSTTSLLPKRHSSTPVQKDFAATFAQLQGAYGFGGTPTPFIPPSSRSTKASLKTSECSSLPLPPPPYSAKDYPAALADLQSTVGFGSVPLLPSPSPKSTSSSSTKSSRRRLFSKPSSSSLPSTPSPSYSASMKREKDFPSALNSLQSSVGFTGAPILPSDSSPSCSSSSAPRPQGAWRSQRLRSLFSSLSSRSSGVHASHLHSGIPTTSLGRM